MQVDVLWSCGFETFDYVEVSSFFPDSTENILQNKYICVQWDGISVYTLLQHDVLIDTVFFSRLKFALLIIKKILVKHCADNLVVKCDRCT